MYKEYMLEVIAFDLDGTLYPERSLYLRMLPKIIPDIKLLVAFNRLRQGMRSKTHISEACKDCAPESIKEFHRFQASMIAEELKMDVDAVAAKIDAVFYKKAEECFRSIRFFHEAEEVLLELKAMGYKLAMLSDFPPERKLALAEFNVPFDYMATSESCGLLKPEPRAFLKMADALGVKPAGILYVGNSERYDIIGAKNAGMKTALISGSRKKRKMSQADFTFSKYSELKNWIIQTRDPEPARSS